MFVIVLWSEISLAVHKGMQHLRRSSEIYLLQTTALLSQSLQRLNTSLSTDAFFSTKLWAGIKSHLLSWCGCSFCPCAVISCISLSLLICHGYMHLQSQSVPQCVGVAWTLLFISCTLSFSFSHCMSKEFFFFLLHFYEISLCSVIGAMLQLWLAS